MSFKGIIKTIYTYFFNWNKIIRFKQFGKNSFIGRRCTVHNCGNGIKIGNNVRIGNDSRLSLYKSEDNIPEILISDNCYIGSDFSIIAGAKVLIEKNVLIASYVSVISENHGNDPESPIYYGKQPLTSSPVTIKEGVWIGEKVSILPGVCIGKKSIIGTGSVVTKNIPDYCIAVGNPARVIKVYNFDTHKWDKASNT